MNILQCDDSAKERSPKLGGAYELTKSPQPSVT